MKTIPVTYLFVLGVLVGGCEATEPFKPRDGSLPFLVYFTSRYRGLCVGTLVSRTAALTAAVCVTNPGARAHDKRPINVVVGATYRHPRRGIRVQVTKILLPRLGNASSHRGYFLQKSPALLMLRRRVPDVLAETPPRPIAVQHRAERPLALHDECLMPGWHFFYKGDKIYPVQRFLLQRNVRVQFLNIAKKHLWCDTLTIKFQKALTNIGFAGHFDKTACICIRDGMYGAPLICRGRAVALLSAPDAQWTNCTGFSNLVHLLSAKHIRSYMDCISVLFTPEYELDWDAMKSAVYEAVDGAQYDYLPALYDKIVEGSSSSEEY